MPLDEFEYVCKLDLDLDLPPRYFELLMDAHGRRIPGSGLPRESPTSSIRRTGSLVPEVCGDEMSVGMTKFYRIPCFREIGGFVRQVMWDGIDCHRCRMLGWIAESVDDQRRCASCICGPWDRARRASGPAACAPATASTSWGHRLSIMVASAVSRLPKHPVLFGSVAMLWGYFSSAARGVPRYDDRFPGLRAALPARVPPARQAGGDPAAERARSRRSGRAAPGAGPEEECS